MVAANVEERREELFVNPLAARLDSESK